MAPPSDAHQAASAERSRGSPPVRTAASRGLSAPHLRSASIAAASTTAPGSAEVQRRMDAFRAASAGPYRVGNESVSVPAGFRMNGGFGASSGDCVARCRHLLPETTFRAIAHDLGVVSVGKGSPEQVRRVVQALIDSPIWSNFAPPSADPSTDPKLRERELSTSIRHMMWDFGIGMDCSGYVHHAFLATRGADTPAKAARYGLGDPTTSGLQAPPAAVFEKRSPVEARPGDVMVLTNDKYDGTGHKVLVYSHTVVPDGEVRRAAATALGSAPSARIHLFEVDSSWGAGHDAEAGGVARRSWAFDESSGRWATVYSPSSHPSARASESSGPYNHELLGIFRPRSAP